MSEKRMKLLGLKGKGGKPATDADTVADLQLKPGAKIMMMGCVGVGGWEVAGVEERREGAGGFGVRYVKYVDMQMRDALAVPCPTVVRLPPSPVLLSRLPASSTVDADIERVNKDAEVAPHVQVCGGLPARRQFVVGWRPYIRGCGMLRWSSGLLFCGGACGIDTARTCWAARAHPCPALLLLPSTQTIWLHQDDFDIQVGSRD